MEEMMQRILLGIICVLTLSPATFATGQAPDRLIYKGKTFDLFSNPLESFYKNEKDRPVFRVAPDVLSSSGNWRGYVATWEVRGGLLYLTGIDAWICTFQEYAARKCRKADLKDLFGEKYAEGRVLADWVTEELRVPDGRMLEYVHMGYGSVYEKELTFSVEAGKVANVTLVDNRKKKRPSNPELQRRELEKLKQSPAGKRKTT